MANIQHIAERIFLPVAALTLALVYATATRAFHRLDGGTSKGCRQERED